MNFLFYILVFILIFIISYFKKNNIELKWKTFFKKGLLVENGPWGVYCYTGKQGSGKTFSVIEFLLEHKDFKIYSNVATLKGVPYIYIGSFQELLNIQNDTDDNIIIFYDEIFTALTKNDKMSKEVLSFLSQMRKRKIIFLTTAQEWLEINITLRRYVRFQVQCSIRTYFNKSFLIKTFYDGENIHWDNLENDYIAPLLSTTISKMNKYVADSYDTYEVIKSSNVKRLEKSSFSQQKANFPKVVLVPGDLNRGANSSTIDNDFWGTNTENLID